MRILHSADWHLRDKDIEEAEKCLAFLVETARKENVDLIVIAGDIFDSQDVRLDSKAARLAVYAVSALADVAPVAVILGTPSHDGKAPEILSYVRGKNPVFIAAKPEEIELAGVILSLIPQPTKQYFQTMEDIQASDREIGSAMSALFAGMGAQAAGRSPHLLVYHGGITGAKLSTGVVLTGREIEVSLDQLGLAQADINCLGHIHAAQKLGDRTFYSGSIYHEDWGEMEPKGFFIHEFYPEFAVIGGEFQKKSRFIETPCKKLVRLEHDFTANGPVENFLEVLQSLPLEDTLNAHVRCDFRVFQDEAGKLAKEEIREYFLSSGALAVDVRIIRVPRQAVRSESVLKVERLRDKIQAMATIKQEIVAESVLLKADALEERQGEELLKEVSA